MPRFDKRIKKLDNSLKVRELIKHLEQFPPNTDVVGLDDFGEPEIMSLFDFSKIQISATKYQDISIIRVTVPRQGWYDREGYCDCD